MSGIRLWKLRRAGQSNLTSESSFTGEKKEAHGRTTHASLEINQFFVYLRDHLLIDPKMSIPHYKIISPVFQLH
jgi:hypothetical protein